LPFAKIVVLDGNCEKGNWWKEEGEKNSSQQRTTLGRGLLTHAGCVKCWTYTSLRNMQVSTTGPLGSVVERVTSNDKVISSILIVGRLDHFLPS
jgi:hypothetical protein